MTIKEENNPWFLEKEYLRNGSDFVVGVDEVGRGPLVGSVVVCAASLVARECKWNSEERNLWASIRDSKKLSESKREILSHFIADNFILGVGKVSPETIDRINILQATFLAMKKAISDWKKNLTASKDMRIKKSSYTAIFLIDGNMTIPNMSLTQRAIEQGDNKVKCISAASIVAKVIRDGEMISLDKKYPAYGFSRHKGYGTREHMDALRRLGPIEEHRKSFAPVKRCLEELRSYGADV
ncbi:MAG: ribonuclease HII [Candidatus Moraniibacteriota bacterium]|nr:MAG: ribonuclease HII [Candidatus Moranbacteria bacterium]